MKTFKSVSIDEVRAFWDARPCNMLHSPKTIGTREYFEEIERRKYFVEPHIPAFAEFPNWRNKRVLEIGCGIGTDTINFARAGAQVTAIDISPKSLELAQRRAEIFSLDGQITFYLGDCEKLNSVIPVEPYDLVYSFGVIHHTPRPELALAQAGKYMDRQSELRIMIYSKVSYKLFWIMKEEGVWDMGRLDELIARNSEAQTGCPVTYTYTLDEARNLLKGFKILEMRKSHIFTWDIDSYRSYEYKKDTAWEGISEAQLEELEKELGWHTLIRARLSDS